MSACHTMKEPCQMADLCSKLCLCKQPIFSRYDMSKGRFVFQTVFTQTTYFSRHDCVFRW